jgi:hypothetical protein
MDGGNNSLMGTLASNRAHHQCYVSIQKENDLKQYKIIFTHHS